MDVIFYGRLADRVGRQVHLAVPAGGCTVAELRRRIAEEHPAIAEDLLGPTVRACVADEIVPETAIVAAEQSVEFFPPVSGG